MSRTKNFFYNSFTTAIMQLAIMVEGFLLPRMIMQFYGSEINGLVSSVGQLVSYFNLLEAGLAGAATYALFKPLADCDNKEINGILSATKKLYKETSVILLFVVFGLSIVCPQIIKSNILSPYYVGLLILTLGINGFLDFYTLGKYKSLLTADQKYYVFALASTVQIMLHTMILVALSVVQIHIVAIMAVAILPIFLRTYLFTRYVRKRYPFLDFTAKPKSSGLNKSWDSLYLKIMEFVQNGAPIFWTAIFADLKLVSVCAIYNMVIGGINAVLSIFISGISASFGNMLAKGEKKTLQTSYSQFEFAYYGLITVVYAIAMMTIMPFVRIYTAGIEDIQYDVPLLGFLFVLNGWLSNVKTPQSMLVISSGMYKETRVQSSVQTFILVLGGAILTPQYGLVGILMASCLGNLYRDFDLLNFISQKVTKLPRKQSAFHIMWMVAGLIISCCPFYYLKVQPVNYITWFGLAILVGMYSSLVVAMIGFAFNRAETKAIYYRFKAIWSNQQGKKKREEKKEE